MKKKFSFIVILCMIMLCFFGCSEKNTEMKNKDNTFDTNAALNLVENYMKGLVRRDYEGVKKMYSNVMLKEQGHYEKSDIIVRGYRVDEVTDLSKSSIYVVKVVSTKMDKYVNLDEYRIEVIKEKNGYKIGDVKIVPQKEVFEQKGEIRIRDKSNVDTNLVIDTEMLPKYAFSKDDKLNLYKQKVPRTSFGNMGISFGGTKVLVSSYEKDCYGAVILIDESLAVQGEQQKGKQGEDSGGGTQQYKGMREKPIGKETVSLDVIKDSKVDYMVFSQDEKFIVMQYTKKDGGKCMRIYESDSGELIPVKFEETFPIDKVNVEFYYFDKSNMFFKVSCKKGHENECKDLIGNWQLDFKNFKIKRI